MTSKEEKEETKSDEDIMSLMQDLNISSKKLDENSSTYLIKNNNKILLEIARRTTIILNDKQEELQQCKWTDGESNTDTDFSKLACKCAEEAWLLVRQQDEPLNIIMVANIPDINCVFSKDEKIIKVPKNKIELKSSKHEIMPGSTIGKLDINQPLIYCHRPNNPTESYEIRYGQYYTAMGESDIDLFQDRTPRPHLNFTKLFLSEEISYCNKKKDAWISHYGKCAFNRVKYKVNSSWQDELTKSIIYEALKNIETMDDVNKLRELVGMTLL